MSALMKQSSASRTATTTRNLEEQIRYRAYELYENRGREDGHDVEDWLQAEAEVSGKAAMPAAA